MKLVPLPVEASFHEELQCYVEHIFCDLRGHSGIVSIAHGGCVDMGGTIALFERIDPNITRIDTHLDDGTPDTVYLKRHGKWEARSAVRGFSA